MAHNLRWDESTQILVFVCGPLLLLLFTVIAFLIRGSRNVAEYPTFTVTISKVGHLEAYVRYCFDGRETEFEAEISRGKNFFVPRISVRLPEDMPEKQVFKIASNLALGLSKLHYEYLIYRKRPPLKVADEEQNAAIAELHQMGFKIDGSAGGQGQVVRAVSQDWRPKSKNKAKATISHVQALMTKASGLRETIEVLARSS
jgi:hypothetical protein